MSELNTNKFGSSTIVPISYKVTFEANTRAAGTYNFADSDLLSGYKRVIPVCASADTGFVQCTITNFTDGSCGWLAHNIGVKTTTTFRIFFLCINN